MYRVMDLWTAFKYSFVISAGVAGAGALVAGGIKAVRKGFSLSKREEVMELTEEVDLETEDQE